MIYGLSADRIDGSEQKICKDAFVQKEIGFIPQKLAIYPLHVEYKIRNKLYFNRGKICHKNYLFI